MWCTAQVVDLDDNRLQAMPTGALRQLVNVRVFIVKNNPLRSIGADDLSPLANVEELNFQNCRLRSVDPGAFRGLQRLVELNLADNELIAIDPVTEHQIPASLVVLRLTGNPWWCDCKLRWLRTWLAASAFDWEQAVGGVPTCAGPGPRLRGVMWRSVDPDEFACSAQIRSVDLVHYRNDNNDGGDYDGSINVSAPAKAFAVPQSQQPAAVRCIAVGDPLPTVSWTTRALAKPLTVNERRTTFDKQPAIESLLSISDETLHRVTSADDNGDDGDVTFLFQCAADNAAGRDEAFYRVARADFRSQSEARAQLLPSSPPTSMVDNRSRNVGSDGGFIAISGKQSIMLEVIFCCSIVGAILLLTILVVCVVCFTATRTKAKFSIRQQPATGDAFTGKMMRADDRRGGGGAAAPQVVATGAGSRDMVSASSAADVNLWRHVVSEAAVVRSKSVSVASGGIMKTDVSSCGSLRLYDSRSLQSTSSFCEYETDLMDESTTAMFRLKVFRPNKPWSACSDCDVVSLSHRSSRDVSERRHQRRRRLPSTNSDRTAIDVSAADIAGYHNQWQFSRLPTMARQPFDVLREYQL